MKALILFLGICSSAFSYAGQGSCPIFLSVNDVSSYPMSKSILKKTSAFIKNELSKKGYSLLDENRFDGEYQILLFDYDRVRVQLKQHTRTSHSLMKFFEEFKITNSNFIDNSERIIIRESNRYFGDVSILSKTDLENFLADVPDCQDSLKIINEQSFNKINTMTDYLRKYSIHIVKDGTDHLFFSTYPSCSSLRKEADKEAESMGFRKFECKELSKEHSLYTTSDKIFSNCKEDDSYHYYPGGGPELYLDMECSHNANSIFEKLNNLRQWIL